MLLRLAINRIRLQRVKKTEESSKHKREIADLLSEGKDELARVRVRELATLLIIIGILSCFMAV